MVSRRDLASIRLEVFCFYVEAVCWFRQVKGKLVASRSQGALIVHMEAIVIEDKRLLGTGNLQPYESK